VDPLIGTSALGVGVTDLLGDLEAAGLHVESLALRDLRVCAQAHGAALSSSRRRSTAFAALIDVASGHHDDEDIALVLSRWAFPTPL